VIHFFSVLKGLEYLHKGCTPKIIHSDVKSTNIILDANMNGKVADFGLSRISEPSYANTVVKGTIGYLDPEYIFICPSLSVQYS